MTIIFISKIPGRLISFVCIGILLQNYISFFVKGKITCTLNAAEVNDTHLKSVEVKLCVDNH